MATARELLDAGDLRGAIEQLTGEIKSNPTDTRRRTFLFELLSFAGEFDRAEKQLDVIGHQDVKAEIGVATYRNCLKAERDRRRLFTDGLQPHFLLEPPAYVDLHLAAINRLREGNYDEARALLDKAEEQRPALEGTFNGQPFGDLRDGDDVLSPVLELVIKDQYTWLPYEQIRSIEIEPPKGLRDLIYTPAKVEAVNGSEGEVLLFALYPDSAAHENDQVKLGRMTDWKNLGEAVIRGSGLHLLFVGEEDKALLEARRVEINAAGGAEEGASA
jgi:type VI secretion system protein ImpE